MPSREISQAVETWRQQDILLFREEQFLPLYHELRQIVRPKRRLRLVNGSDCGRRVSWVPFFTMTSITTTLVWLCFVVLLTLGCVGTVVPALPGTPLMFLGILLLAWWYDFVMITTSTVVITAVLAIIALAVDLVASALGARRVGASSYAITGSTLGACIGIFFALPGLLLGPFIGAVLGELYAQANLLRATKAGVATWMGMIAGTIIKLVIALAMIGLSVLDILR